MNSTNQVMGALQSMMGRTWEFGEAGTSLNILSEANVNYLIQHYGVESLTRAEISKFNKTVII